MLRIVAGAHLLEAASDQFHTPFFFFFFFIVEVSVEMELADPRSAWRVLPLITEKELAY